MIDYVMADIATGFRRMLWAILAVFLIVFCSGMMAGYWLAGR